MLQDNSYQELMRTVEDIAEQYNVKLFRIKGSMNEMEKNNIFYKYLVEKNRRNFWKMKRNLECIKTKK